MSPARSVKLEAAKIKKLIASVNIIEVLLLRFRCPSRFLLTTYFNLLSLKAQVHISRARNPFSTNSKSKTDIKVNPIIIMISRESKINKNHIVFRYQNVKGTQ